MKTCMLVLLALISIGCVPDEPPATRSVVILLDPLSNALDPEQQVVPAVHALIGSLRSDDAFALIRIDRAQRSAQERVMAVRLSDRPGLQMQQKLLLLEQLDAVLDNPEDTGIADISGGLQQAEWLFREYPAEHQLLVLYSDLQPRLPDGLPPAEFNLAGISILAVPSVSQAESAIAEAFPRVRVEQWRRELTANGAVWMPVELSPAMLLQAQGD